MIPFPTFNLLATDASRFLVYLIVILALAYLANFLLANSAFRHIYRFFVAPGVILHELSHALFCLSTGAKIDKIALFEKDGGSVTHGKPKIPIIGDILISVSPFFIGLAAIYLLSVYMGMPKQTVSPEILPQGNWLALTKTTFTNVDFGNLLNWLAVYLIISIAVTMTPSWQDIKNISVILIVSFVVVVFLVKLGVNFHISAIPFAKTFEILSSVSVVLIATLVLSAIVFGVSKLIRI